MSISNTRSQVTNVKIDGPPFLDIKLFKKQDVSNVVIKVADVCDVNLGPKVTNIKVGA